ncbi:response regulator [Pelomonas sp. KK5]|uniref:response regulator n=1 Tax=Pelomonas sp. KK5 TaxID=1855730 RepID=UPI00097C7840|nr:response regulator [Pelomonas sp. KK5]
MNVFLVEDSPAIRRLLVRRLNQMPGMRVVGEAMGETQALAMIQWTRPDVVLTDLALAEGSGIKLLAALRRGGFDGHIAVLTSQDADAWRPICLRAGADAFYDKGTGLETLFDHLATAEAMGRGTAAGDEPPALLLRAGLTGLCCDAVLHERLDQASRQATQDGCHLAVYVLRIEGLATLPAALAEQVELQVTERLRLACSEADIVARPSPSQFCVVLTRLEDAGLATAYARRLGALAAEPIQHGDAHIRLAVEIGMALFPNDAVSPGGLLTLAEASAFGAL